MEGESFNSDVNANIAFFMDTIHYDYDAAFQLKIVYRSNVKKNKWIT
jgi:hypothetical protein